MLWRWLLAFINLLHWFLSSGIIRFASSARQQCWPVRCGVSFVLAGLFTAGWLLILTIYIYWPVSCGVAPFLDIPLLAFSLRGGSLSSPIYCLFFVTVLAIWCQIRFILDHCWNKISLWIQLVSLDRSFKYLVATRSQFRGIGDKSLWWVHCSLFYILIFTFIMTQTDLHRYWGEGWNTATSVPEAETSVLPSSLFETPANLSGVLPTMSYGSNCRLPVRNVHKRSYRRACKRAIQHGFAWYHGRCFDLSDFPVDLRQKIAQELQPQVSTQKVQPTGAMTPSKRIKLFVWNPSGLTKPKLSEIIQWLELNMLDVAILPETHWTFTNAWKHQQWNVIHSGCASDRSSGVMILIRNKFCTSDSISWHSVYDGRLLHVRLNCFVRPVDILGSYQFADHRSDRRLQQRSGFWKSLDDYLVKLPRRNVLALAGDFNCTLSAHSGLIGGEMFRWQGAPHASIRHSDSAVLQHILVDHDVVALNTWNAALGPTYVNGQTASRIDFVCTRTAYADGMARDVHMIPDAPFVQSLHNGHVPMLCHLPELRLNCKPKPAPSVTTAQRKAAYHAWKAQTPDWMGFQQTAAAAFDTYIHQVKPSDVSNMTQLHQSVIPHVQNYFQGPSTVHESSFSPEVLNKWQHLRLARHETLCNPAPSLRSWFRCWFHLARHRALDRSHKKHAAQLQKQKLLNLLEEAENAANRHDAHRLHHLISRHAPKAPKRPIHLRTPGGALAHPYEEIALYRQHIHEVWHSDHAIPNHHTTPPGVPFSEYDLQQAFAHAPLHKAVAKPFLPGVIIRALAEPLAHYIFPLLEVWWQQNPPYFPQEWKDGWLCFLNKPGKPPNTPNNLRPICLQEPIGKCISGLLASLASQQVFPVLCQWPQFAYTQLRSAQDAILRVAVHCQKVRTLTQMQRPSVHTRATGFEKHLTCGGIQMFVDLSRAFDSVPRHALFPDLHSFGISNDLANLLTALHTGTNYHFFHSGEFHTVSTGKGVRQGCKIAPLLWSCYMLKFMRLVADALGPQWVRQHLTLFADDLHIGILFHNQSELLQALSSFGIVLDILTDLGMTINVAKSAVQLKIAGTSYRKLVSRLIRRTVNGAFVQIPRQKDASWIRLEGKTPYLGVTVSYGPLEALTLQTRMSAGQSAFRRLRLWLTRRQISVKNRLRLWHTCIFPVFTYGIFTVGLTYQGLHNLQQIMYRQLRLILGDHAYCTRRTHQEALASRDCATPLQRLLTAVQAQLRSTQTRQSSLLEQDIVHLSAWDCLIHAKRLIEIELLQGPAVPIAADSEADPQTKRIFQCPHCEFATDNIPNLRRHRTNIHNDTQYRTLPADISQNAIMGLPQCRNCFTAFTTWRSFRVHLQRGVCQVPVPHTSAQPRVWVDEGLQNQTKNKTFVHPPLCPTDGSVNPPRSLPTVPDHPVPWCQVPAPHPSAQPRVRVDEGMQNQIKNKTFVHPPLCTTDVSVHLHPPRSLLLTAPTVADLSASQTVPTSLPLQDSEHQLLLQLIAEDMSRADQPHLQVKLLASDLTHLRTMDHGPWLMDLVNSRAWDDLATAQELCTHLTQHCVLCGLFTGRLQELLGHLKLYHADHMPNVHCKSAQLTKKLVTSSPCRYCSRTYKSSHVCPVLMQASLLLVNGGGLDEEAGLDNVRSILHCDLCDRNFETPALVHKHLREAHKLALHDWNLARDCVQGSPACAHCGSVHESREGLRRHILYGHCPEFDANKPAETAPLDDTLTEALNSGSLTSLLQPPERRLALTLGCLCCAETYTRGIDLAAHLQQCHGKLWTQSTSTLNLLIDTVMTQKGCICNPGGSAASSNLSAHQCVGLRQLAMHYVRTDVPILVPYTFDSVQISQKLSTLLASCIIDQFTDALIARRFPDLYTDQDFLDILRSKCLQCGVELHPADLCAHIFQDHGMHSKISLHFVDALSRVLQPRLVPDHTCGACTVAFDTPGNPDHVQHMQAAQVHLKGTCPVVAQLAWLLAPDNGGRSRLPRSAHGSFSKHCTSFDSGSNNPAEPSTRSQETEGRGTTRVSDHARSRPRRQGKRNHAQALGDDGGEIGSGASGLAKARLFHLLHANKPPGSADPAGREGQELASTEEGKSGPSQGTTTEGLPPETHDGRAEDQGGESSCHRTGRSFAANTPETWTPAGGRELAFSEMVPSTTEAPNSVPTTLDAQEHGDPADIIGGIPERSSADHSVSFLETSRSEADSGPMASEGEYEGRRLAWPSEIPGRERCLAASWGNHEATQPAPTSFVQAAPGHCESHQDQERQGEGQALTPEPNTGVPLQWLEIDGYRKQLTSLVLGNDSNWCFANAATVAFLWSTLSRLDFVLTDWGQHASLLKSMLLQHGDRSVLLTDMPLFRDLFVQWQMRARQHDAAEYTSFLLGGLGLQNFQQSWERRVLEQNEVTVFDAFKQFQPLRLQFPSDADTPKTFLLQQLIDSWHEDLGMRAALLGPPPLLCLQVDRAGYTAEGHLLKLQHTVCFRTCIDMPVFLDKGVNVACHAYLAVAVVAHFGPDLPVGHYRCLLKGQDTRNGRVGVQWFVTDDNEPMTARMDETDKFAQNVTMLWLCRRDLLHLFDRKWMTDADTAMRDASINPGSNDVLSFF